MIAHRFTLILLFLLIACGGFNDVQAERRAMMSITITSPAFSHDGSIPAVYTCDGKDISPELNWSDIPANAKSLVLIVDDPDAPDPAAPKMTWVHWVPVTVAPARRLVVIVISINSMHWIHCCLILVNPARRRSNRRWKIISLNRPC